MKDAIRFAAFIAISPALPLIAMAYAVVEGLKSLQPPPPMLKANDEVTIVAEGVCHCNQAAVCRPSSCGDHR